MNIGKLLSLICKLLILNIIFEKIIHTNHL